MEPFFQRPPRVSVVMPVYNGAPFLKEAMESVLRQSYENFEFIIINDGSTDNSEQLIRSFEDRRIRYVSQRNQGVAKTLNTGIDLATGEFVARQDQDDVSLPARLERQVAFLEGSPSTAMVGTWARILRGGTAQSRYHRHPCDYYSILLKLLLDNPFVHSSVMLRKSTLQDVGNYSLDAARQPPEDYELWSRIARRYELRNIPEVLLYYREVDSSMSRDKERPFAPRVARISIENIAFYSGRRETDSTVVAVSHLAHGVHREHQFVSFRRMRKVLLEAFESIGSICEPTEEGRLVSRRLLLELRRRYLTTRFGVDMRQPHLIPLGLAKQGYKLLKQKPSQ